MERVLEVYQRPYDPLHPVICMDETPRQLIEDTRPMLPAKPGVPVREDYEYKREGTCAVFMAVEPLGGWRMAKVTKTKTRMNCAAFAQEIAAAYPLAARITLVMDNLNIHSAGSFYEALPPDQAKALWDRFEFIYTPKHGSWLNMAEIELSSLAHQCLNRRIGKMTIMKREVLAWTKARNGKTQTINWQFTTADARIKLARLYPTFKL